MDQDLKEKLTSKSKWIRLLFMILFGIIINIVEMVIWIIAAFQFIVTLFIGKPNANLATFSDGLTTYAYQMMRYLTYNNEVKPFPFTPWPSACKESKPAPKKKA